MQVVHPRPVRWKLLTKQQKSELFGIKKNLLQMEHYKKVIIANDYDDDELLTLREARLINNAANSIQGVTSRLKGLAVGIDDKLYTKNDFVNLPHDLSPENVSTITTELGIFFQGHNSPLSSLICIDVGFMMMRVDLQIVLNRCIVFTWRKRIVQTHHLEDRSKQRKILMSGAREENQTD